MSSLTTTAMRPAATGRGQPPSGSLGLVEDCLPCQQQRALGEASGGQAALGAVAASPLGPRLLGFTLLAAGGALTGGLAAQSYRGAAIGSLAHLALGGAAAAIWGAGVFSPVERWIYGAAAVLAAGGAGYLVVR
ncbi:MAG: hypothetical protein JSV86_05385 [Gemmatimonadota bacterium]|nr:MAG: hypothetical protein JSV86_05385 [Gemmatimonadota bacterium]